MSAESKAFQRVARRSDVAPGSALVVESGRYEVALFDVGGELRAYENACPHQGGPIGEGQIEDGCVVCPWHAWRFNLSDGKMTLGDFAALRRFEVRVEGSDVWLAGEPEPE
jgi:nitrite reductase/ring-hydroxylating ferredoxin subunit